MHDQLLRAQELLSLLKTDVLLYLHRFAACGAKPSPRVGNKLRWLQVERAQIFNQRI